MSWPAVAGKYEQELEAIFEGDSGSVAALKTAELMARSSDEEIGVPIDRQALARSIATIRRRLTPPVVRRTAGRAPRRPTATRTARLVSDGGGGDDPPGDPPRRSDGQRVAGALIHQGNSGLPRRKYLALIPTLGIPYRRVGRLLCVRAEDFFEALGLQDVPRARELTWSPDHVLRLIRSGK
jgi:hypothetical protein